MRYAEEQTANPTDFVPRRRLPTIVQFTILFSFFFAIIFSIYGMSSGMFSFGAFALIAVAGLAAAVVVSVQRTRDMALATEFQNSIYASALAVNSKFCLIIRRDGSVVYFDRGLQEIFPGFTRLNRRTLQALLEMAQVSKAESDQIFSAVERHAVEKLAVTMRSPIGATSYVITIDPIMRPSQFIMIRGRDFVDNRQDYAGAMPQGSGNAAQILSSISDDLPFGVYATDSKGVISYMNNALCQMLNYSKMDIAAGRLTLQQLIYQEPTSPHSGVELQAFKGEVLLQTRNNKTLRAMVHQQLQMNAQGQQNGCVAAVYEGDAVDVKKKSTILDSTSSSTESLENFISESPIATVKINAAGQITASNQAFHLLTQNTLSGTVDLPQLTPEAKHAEVAQLLQKSLSGEISDKPAALELVLPNGSTVMVSMYLSKPTAGEIVAFFIDTTEQKNLELRFAHSQKMQAVGQLAGGVAHDFNNLLTAMIGFCDLLLMRHPAGDQSFADIMQVKQNANRAANLVRQLLAFSRRQTLQPKMLDITDVLAELSNLIRRLIGENIELKMIHGRDLGLVKVDQGQLEQVLINLAVNARDAMKDGGVLTIRTNKSLINAGSPLPRGYFAPAEEDSSLPPGEYVLVEVIDSGTGIPRAILQKIFEPFFSTKEVGSGTGLGLSTVYGIIKQTGGYIFVSSKEAEGTKFSLYLPAYQAKDHPVVEAESTEKADNVDLTGKSTILLVEDETPVRIFAGRALRNKGYTVLEADCGETGMDIFKEKGNEIELIITDVIMPGMNGPTMVDKIMEEKPSIKVIFMSGYAEDVFRNNYGTERSFNFLAKPFTLKQLASKAKEVLSGK